MTEEKAKTKWCKDRSMRSQLINLTGFLAANTALPHNKQAAMDAVIAKQRSENSNCIASECMMWRNQSCEVHIMKGSICDCVLEGYCGLAR